MPPANQFSMLLTEAIYRIRSLESKDGKSIQMLQDELGYAIGRETGGSAIEHWRKGNVPAQYNEVEALAREIMRRSDLDRRWLERFLVAGKHPNPALLCDELRPAGGAVQRELHLPSMTSEPGDEPAADFIAGPPITHPRQFFGRSAIVRRIFELLRRLPLQNSAIIGPRRSGKTSLLHYLRAITCTPAAQLRPGQRNDWLPDPERYRWVLVDFQDARMGRLEGLLRHLLGALLLPVPAPCTLDRCLDVLSDGIGTPTVVLLDELGVALQRYPELTDEFWESLRALGPQLGGRLGFVLAAHTAPAQLAGVTGHSSPFFNIFGYTAHLGPLTEAEVDELIAAAPRPIDPADIAWIKLYGRGWPMILQTLCRERMSALELNMPDEQWRAEALRQIEPYRDLP
jgi:hypothetical protein